MISFFLQKLTLTQEKHEKPAQSAADAVRERIIRRAAVELRDGMYGILTPLTHSASSRGNQAPQLVRWVVGSILHGGGGGGAEPLSYFLFQPVLHDWCNKGYGMCYPVFGTVHIKEPLLLIGKISPCGSSAFPFSLSEWSLTICLTPYNRK